MRALQFALCFASHQRTVCFEFSFAFALTPNIVVVSFPADFVLLVCTGVSPKLRIALLILQ